MNRKRRSINQIKEDTSYHVLREKLPESWVIHEYGPDYGIDYVVELFDYIDDKKTMAETLGENFFVQLKASSSIEYATKRVYSRGNIEKGKLTEDKSEFFDIEVAKFQLEMSDLLTVQSMGIAIPVLLILVDVTTRRAFFICLNDYIDKVLAPEDSNYSKKESKTLYIPLRNEILNCEPNLVPLRVYGKRSKMYGAFSKFYYQNNEIKHAIMASYNIREAREFALGMISTFLETAIRQDIWRGHEFWIAIEMSFNDLSWVRRKLEQGIKPEEYEEFLQYCYSNVWNRLANLSNVYEEIVREWFMPTYLSLLTS
ncbi:DUF4365 domain-containing protein [Anabaena sp. CCY 9910]|uniref:DUF4365 domain-containing protein n=1 Tax=Anabaena sp. CCY 9910 TaxID=3103870 RepID=UPI0039E1F2B0